MFRIVWFIPKNFESVCSKQCPENFIANASQIVIVAIVDGEYSYKWSQISAPDRRCNHQKCQTYEGK